MVYLSQHSYNQSSLVRNMAGLGINNVHCTLPSFDKGGKIEKKKKLSLWPVVYPLLWARHQDTAPKVLKIHSKDTFSSRDTKKFFMHRTINRQTLNVHNDNTELQKTSPQFHKHYASLATVLTPSLEKPQTHFHWTSRNWCVDNINWIKRHVQLYGSAVSFSTDRQQSVIPQICSGTAVSLSAGKGWLSHLQVICNLTWCHK